MVDSSKIFEVFVDNFDNKKIDDDSVSILLNLIRNPKVNINYQDESQNTILIHLALYGRTSKFEDIIEELLKRDDIDVNKQNYDGSTALIYASKYSNTCSTERTVEMLLQQPDLDVNLQDNKKSTALMLACQYSNSHSSERTIELLLQHPKIDINLQNKNGDSTIIILYKKNIMRLVRLLLQHPETDYNFEYEGKPFIRHLVKDMDHLSDYDFKQVLNIWLGRPKWKPRKKLVMFRKETRASKGLGM
jgi:ankyrin repeat protein